MIARIWRGRTPASKGEEYLEYVKQTGVDQLRSTEGNRGVYVLQRMEGDVAEIIVLSLWDSHDAINRFAGPDPEKAVYYPKDREYLLELEPHVTHYDVPVAP
jgi:heme-degrading monooxygenase HmoA